MKTAISVPDDVFNRINQFARQRGVSRSAVFAAAAREYVQKHRVDGVTRKLNEVYARGDDGLDPVLAKFQAQSLPKEPWE